MRTRDPRQLIGNKYSWESSGWLKMEVAGNMLEENCLRQQGHLGRQQDWARPWRGTWTQPALRAPEGGELARCGHCIFPEWEGCGWSHSGNKAHPTGCRIRTNHSQRFPDISDVMGVPEYSDTLRDGLQRKKLQLTEPIAWSKFANTWQDYIFSYKTKWRIEVQVNELEKKESLFTLHHLVHGSEIWTTITNKKIMLNWFSGLVYDS